MFQPTTFGKYFLTRRIAVGGMAEVFQAKLYGADGFEKDLVIKQILPQYARDPEFVQSFVAEAKIAVTLTHANVVGIYELGRVDGTYFIAMEYVDGLDVFSLIDAARRHQRKISIGSVLLIAEEVAKGLDYAHRKTGPDKLPLGLVHRDLNPRNVLVSVEGDIKILDFGIAKTASMAVAEMPKTRAGVVKGTTGYMSPEQATGREVDHRTDIYQTGLVLFEMLTSQALFWRPDDQQTRDLMRKHQVIPPSQLNAESPPELDEIVARCLERKADLRYQTAAELAAALAQVRYAKYAQANQRDLGELVNDLARAEAQEEEVAAQSLPSTQELSAVISQAIDQTVTGHVETIATRAPSNVILPQVPATGSQPLVVQQPPAPRTATPARPPPPVPPPTGAEAEALEAVKIESIPDEETIDPPLTMPPKPSPLRRWAPILAAAILFGGAFAGVRMLNEPTPATPPPPPPIEVAMTPDAGVIAPEVAPPPPPPAVVAPPPKAVPKVVKKRRPKKRKTKTKTKVVSAEPGTVSFGTRSCSSRVSVDGQVVTDSTPSFNHRLSAGPHRVLIEGTSCPPIERPGSLRRTLPRVSRVIRVEPGTKMRVIADFDQQQLLVKRDGS